MHVALPCGNWASLHCLVKYKCKKQQWFSRLISWFTVATFCSVRECFGLPLVRLWSVLLVSRMLFTQVSRSFRFAVCLWKFCHYSSRTVFLNWYKFVMQQVCLLELVKHVVCSGCTVHDRRPPPGAPHAPRTPRLSIAWSVPEIFAIKV